jgi:beta-mannosidase
MSLGKFVAIALCVGWCGALLGSSSPPLNRQLSLAGEWRMQAVEELSQPAEPLVVDDSSWQRMAVPGNWHLAGLDLSGSVWFSRHFRVPPNTKGQQVQLVFEGVDYAAEVWLNGHRLGAHEGYFEPFQFDLSGKLAYDGENQLLVLVHSPTEEVGPVWSLHKRLIKGVYGQHDTRPGGAWSPRGQEQNTGGIWAPVFLRFSNRVTIVTSHATPSPAGPGPLRVSGEPWELQVELGVMNPAREPLSVQIELSLVPLNFLVNAPTGGSRTMTVLLKPGRNQLNLKLDCANTQLWWSWDRGAPNLYQWKASLQTQGELLDEAGGPVGFRTIAVDPATNEWRLNGKRLFLRGTNYISTQWLSEMTAEKYNFDLSLMKRANINAIRVHAHVEAQDFYHACDEAGVLVWQDFPLQWGYSDSSEFQQEAVRQALGMVSLLRDHPSVIGWTMHNEPPWDASWMQYKYKDYDPEQNKILDHLLWSAVSQADPTRYTHEHSDTAEHPWLGWYSGSWRDYGKPTTQPFISEFGAQALPDLPSLVKIFGPDGVWPDTEAKWQEWDYHNFQKHEMVDLAHVSLGSSIAEFIHNTQQYQVKVTDFAAESYRRQRFQPVTAIFQFMFVEDWPSVNWGVVDYWRNPKPGYFALANAYQLVLPSIDQEQESWNAGEKVLLDLWVINDKEEAFPGSKLIANLRCHNEIVQSQSFAVDLAGDSAARVSTLAWRELPVGSYDLSVRIEDSHGDILGSNHSSFQVIGQGGS